MGNLYKHRYTWLIVFLVTYIIEVLTAYVLLSFVAGDANIIANWGLYMMPLFVALAGLLAGLLINICTRFHRAVLCYIIGQVLSLICFYGYFKWTPTNAPVEIPQEQNADPVEPSSGVFNRSTRTSLETVFFRMEQDYPLGAYVLDHFDTEYISNDTSGNSGIICTIMFTVPEENARYVSRYYALGDSLSAIYEKKDTATIEYQKFRKEMLKKDMLPEE